MSERRQYPRMRVLKSREDRVWHIFSVDCVVRDLSSTGAHIQIQNAIGLPEAVDITFDGGHTFRPCRLKWRTLNEMGVEFFDFTPKQCAA